MTVLRVSLCCWLPCSVSPRSRSRTTFTPGVTPSQAVTRASRRTRQAPGGRPGRGFLRPSPRAHSESATTSVCGAPSRRSRAVAGARGVSTAAVARRSSGRRQVALADVVAEGRPGRRHAPATCSASSRAIGEGAEPTGHRRTRRSMPPCGPILPTPMPSTTSSSFCAGSGWSGSREGEGRTRRGRPRPCVRRCGCRATGVGILMVLAARLLRAPWGLLLCAPALVPLVALAVAFARQRRVALALGLEPVPGRRALRAAAPLVLACLLVGVAAARPVMDDDGAADGANASEVVFVTDVSQSMLAAPRAGAPTRLERTRFIVRQHACRRSRRAGGLAGLTDRALPYPSRP